MEPPSFSLIKTVVIRALFAVQDGVAASNLSSASRGQRARAIDQPEADLVGGA